MPRVTDWPWPFDDPPESEVFVSPDVASGAARVAFVGHYDDGDWVFLSEGGRRSDALQAMSFGDLRRVVPDLRGLLGPRATAAPASATAPTARGWRSSCRRTSGRLRYADALEPPAEVQQAVVVEAARDDLQAEGQAVGAAEAGEGQHRRAAQRPDQAVVGAVDGVEPDQRLAAGRQVEQRVVRRAAYRVELGAQRRLRPQRVAVRRPARCARPRSSMPSKLELIGVPSAVSSLK